MLGIEIQIYVCIARVTLRINRIGKYRGVKILALVAARIRTIFGRYELRGRSITTEWKRLNRISIGSDKFAATVPSIVSQTAVLWRALRAAWATILTLHRICIADPIIREVFTFFHTNANLAVQGRLLRTDTKRVVTEVTSVTLDGGDRI